MRTKLGAENASTDALGKTGRGGAEEDGTQEVVAAMSSAVGPSKRISPRSMKKQRWAKLRARFRLCSTRITVVP